MAALKRWIIRYKGQPQSDSGENLKAAIDASGITVVDSNLPKMVLAQGNQKQISKVKEVLDANWTIVEQENIIQHPPKQSDRVRKKMK